MYETENSYEAGPWRDELSLFADAEEVFLRLYGPDSAERLPPPI